MRLHLAAVTAALVLVPAAAVPARADAPAAVRGVQPAAETGLLVTNAHFETLPGGAVPRVSLRSASGVTRVDMRLRGTDGTTAYDDVRRTAGTVNDGLWNTPSVVALHAGRTYLDLEVTEASGTHTTITAAAFSDATGRAWDVTAQPEYPVATSAFRGKADVTLTGAAPERVTMRLYRAGTDEPVGEALLAAAVKRSDFGDYSMLKYETVGTFDPPAGDYEIVATAFDAQGDHVSDRSSVVARRLAQKLVFDKIDPGSYDAEHPDVTVTGRVTDASGTPLPGVQVSNGDTTTTTDASGGFTLTVNAMRDAMVKVAAHGGYLETSQTVPVKRQLVQTSLTVRSSVIRARVGDTVTLSGALVSHRESGPDAPLPGRTVELSVAGDRTPEKPVFPPVKVTTGADGRFSTQLRLTRAGDWAITANLLQDADYAGAIANAPLSADHPTAVVMSGPAPKQAALGSKITLRGKVVRLNVPSDQAVVREGGVELEYSQDRKHWMRESQVRFAKDGTFALTGTVAKDGYWRVRYAGAGVTFPASPPAFELPSTGASYYVDAKYRTAITSFNASPEPVRKGRTLAVKGRLTKQVGKWQPGAGALVQIYFKPKGSSKWKAMGTAKSDRNGWFTKNFKASADGTWAAAYAGSSTYLGVWSAGDYVDVR